MEFGKEVRHRPLVHVLQNDIQAIVVLINFKALVNLIDIQVVDQTSFILSHEALRFK